MVNVSDFMKAANFTNYRRTVFKNPIVGKGKWLIPLS